MTANQSHSPPGWSTNPSKWSQRIPIVVLAVIGTGVATYLALFQLRVIDTVWEPFFGDGSRQILRHSSFSRFFERFGLSDAAIISLAMIGPAADEVLASLQYLRRQRTKGHSTWRAFSGVDERKAVA